MGKPKHKCLDCDNLCSGRAIRCRKCNGIYNRKYPELSRKEYAQNWQRQKKYNLTPEEFEAFWITGQGKCWICKNKLEKPRATRGQLPDVVAIDHDHITGKVRGLLCNKCNKGLGFFNDDIELLKKAIEYLGG